MSGSIGFAVAPGNLPGSATDVVNRALTLLSKGLPADKAILVTGLAQQAYSGVSFPLVRYWEGTTTTFRRSMTAADSR